MPRRYAAIAAASLGTVVAGMDGSIVNVALPTLARDLHVQPAAVVLVITVYQLVLMMTLLPLSALGQRIGLRATMLLGLAIYLAGTVLCFLANTLLLLVIVRGIQALGAAAVLSVISAMIRNIYPLSHLGRGLSFNTVIAASAASFAPTVGGAILAVAAWPWLFAIVAPFAVLSILIGRKALPIGMLHNEPYDFAGAAMCATTFGLGVWGIENAVQADMPWVSVALIALSIALGTVFVRRELRQSKPVMPVDLLRTRTIALPCVGSLAAYISMTIVMVSLPFRLQQQFNFSPAAAGAMLAPMPLVSMVVAPTSGLLSDRIAAGVLGGIGMGIGVTGLLCLAFLPASPDHIDILWRVAILGVGFGMFFSPNARQIIGAAPAARAAAAGALFSTIRGAGQTLGATAIAAVLAIGFGNTSAPGLIAAVLALLAGLCSVAALRPASIEAS